jgi:Flp pilus assembly protein TadG
MRWSCRKKVGTFSDAEDGVVALEFVILFPLFLLVIMGIVEFGHLFYVRHTLTNASREGARAGVVYYSPPIDGSGPARDIWAATEATTAITNYLGLGGGQTPRLPGVTLDLHPEVSGGTSPFVSGSTSGSTVTVGITASNVLLVLDKLITLSNPITVTTETTMRLE